MFNIKFLCLLILFVALLEQPYNVSIHRFKSAKKILDLYASCTDTDSRETLGIKPLLQLLNRAGGWPVITKEWDEESYDWERTYIFLRSELNVKYLIDMYVDTDTIDKKRRVIYVSADFVLLDQRKCPVTLTSVGHHSCTPNQTY